MTLAEKRKAISVVALGLAGVGLQALNVLPGSELYLAVVELVTAAVVYAVPNKPKPRPRRRKPKAKPPVAVPDGPAKNG